MASKKLLELLNKGIAREIQVSVQYMWQHVQWSGIPHYAIKDELKKVAIEEMKHADAVIGRILFLDGVPNMQRMNPVKVGQDPIEQHRVDLALELDARERLNRGIDLARKKGDDGTRQLLSEILESEEEGIDWLETHIKLAEDLGKENYLAQMIKGG